MPVNELIRAFSRYAAYIGSAGKVEKPRVIGHACLEPSYVMYLRLLHLEDLSHKLHRLRA